jgi:hypothetical protein
VRNAAASSHAALAQTFVHAPAGNVSVLLRERLAHLKDRQVMSCQTASINVHLHRSIRRSDDLYLTNSTC